MTNAPPRTSPDGRLAARLATTFPQPAASDLVHLHSRLTVRADREDLLDLAYRTVDSPYGSLLVAATPVGLVRVAFPQEDHDEVLATLAETVSPRILESGTRTDEVARQLDEYFAGRRRSFDLDVDLRLVDGFRRTVIAHLSDIAYGTTQSYASVAQLAGNPRAVRAVGSACSHNPIPVVLPCHRVVRSDGSLGQYLGGAEAKATLIALEAAS
jgi:methylated-DNA-[protein]-cysteine S-methyltransferase